MSVPTTRDDGAGPLVAVIGLGGVGSHCAHALVRSGIKRLVLVDFDRVSLSSLNRHAVATRRDVGISKVAACAAHFRSITPDCAVEAHDEMFTADVAGRFLGDGGQPPAIVVDCIDDLPTKADLLEACVARGLNTLSALGAGGKGDPTRLCVARGLQDIENDPLASKLRTMFRTRVADLSKVAFVYSSQKADRALLPLTDEQRKSPAEFGNVANFRLRVLPVLGTQPALEGVALAAQVLSELASPVEFFSARPSAPPSRKYAEKLHEQFRRREGAIRVDITVSEVHFLLHEVWRGRSVLDEALPVSGASGLKFVLARWDPSLPASPGNVLLVTEGEAAAHEGPAGVDPTTRQRVEKLLQHAAARLALPECIQANGGSPSARDDASAGEGGRCMVARPMSWRCIGGAPGGTEDDHDEALLVQEQLSRSSAFFGTTGQERIRAAFVVVIGAGSVGSAAASLLFRAGIRRIRLVDGGRVRAGGMHAFATYCDEGEAKVEVCRRALVAVRPRGAVEAIAAHFTTTTAAEHLAAASDGTQPDLVVDCIGDMRTKVGVLGAAAARGIRTITVVAHGGHCDPTRAAVAPLAQVHACPATVALRLAVVQRFGFSAPESISAVYSQEVAPWSHPTEAARETCGQLTRLSLGMVATALALHALAGEELPPPPPPSAMATWKKLKRGFRQLDGDSAPLDALAVGCVVDHVWRGRSALSRRFEASMRLVQWDRSRPLTLDNLVLLTDDEAAVHDAATTATGSMPAALLRAMHSGSPCDGVDGLLRAHRNLERLRCYLAVAGCSNDVSAERPKHMASAEGWIVLRRVPAAAVGGALAGAVAAIGFRRQESKSLRTAIVSAVVVGSFAGKLTEFASTSTSRMPRREGLLRAPPAIRPKETACGPCNEAAEARHGGRANDGQEGNAWTQRLAGVLRFAGLVRRDHEPMKSLTATGHFDARRLGAGFGGLVGNTPLVELPSLSEATGCRIVAKAEFLSPGGCQKDRVARQIVQEAEACGQLRPGATIVEGTSGSTGISLALAAGAGGYRLHIVMPDDQAAEKIELLRRFGAEVELVRPASISSPEHYVNVAKRRAKEFAAAPGSAGAIFADQFENPANFRAHFGGTGPELWTQCGHQLDAFVMSAGTGGTLAGVGCFLKSVAPVSRIYLADVEGSSLYNKVAHGVLYAPEQQERTVRRHRMDTIAEGIGLDRLTANFARGLCEHNGGEAGVDAAIRVTDQEALDMAHYVLAHEGLFIGSSAAVNCVGACKVARKLGSGHTVATVLCDSGTRHVSKFYNPAAWEHFGLSCPAARMRGDLSFVS